MPINKDTALQFKGGSCSVSMVGASDPRVVALFAKEMNNNVIVPVQKTGHSL